ncbi:MAG: hypothetical protein C5B56_04015 [Proteobacteria bacterium]|nr:MAG: hypothetical protein C5B56_04015 [Pseudomonadota bacterium]
MLMKVKLLAAGALLALTSPAFAAFYIVQDQTSKECSISQMRPAAPGVSVVGGADRAYQTRTEAEVGMRAEPTCQPSTTGSNPGGPAPSGTPRMNR